jgi:hypothetical protein
MYVFLFSVARPQVSPLRPAGPQRGIGSSFAAPSNRIQRCSMATENDSGRHRIDPEARQYRSIKVSTTPMPAAQASTLIEWLASIGIKLWMLEGNPQARYSRMDRLDEAS